MVCAFLSCVLLVSDAQYRYLGGLRSTASAALFPLQWLARAPFVLADHVADTLVTRKTLFERNGELEIQHGHDAVQLQELAALSSENAHLRGLLVMRERYAGKTLAAEIAYRGRDPFTQKVVLDRGSSDGVEAGRPVIDETGVVGQVTRVYPWLSEVTLITDAKQMVPVQNLRNGLRAVLAGTGNTGRLELKFIALSADFAPGDDLVTSGIDGVYPPGLPVARVSAVEHNPNDLFARISCEPVTGVHAQRQLLVVDWKNPMPEAPPPEADTPPAPRAAARGAARDKEAP